MKHFLRDIKKRGRKGTPKSGDASDDSTGASDSEGVVATSGVEVSAGSTPTQVRSPERPQFAPIPKLQTALSQDFYLCKTSELIVLVSSMLQELVGINDALPFSSSNLTRFHSRSPPSISIIDYLKRITKYCTLEKSILLAMVYFIDLLCNKFTKFNINSLTVHRFMITAAMIGSKGLCDSFCTNRHYARVGGVQLIELNLLEVEFLVRVDYQIVPTLDLLNQYYAKMVARFASFEPVQNQPMKPHAGVEPDTRPDGTQQIDPPPQPPIPALSMQDLEPIPHATPISHLNGKHLSTLSTDPDAMIISPAGTPLSITTPRTRARRAAHASPLLERKGSITSLKREVPDVEEPPHASPKRTKADVS